MKQGLKIASVIILMCVIWFSKDVFWYSNFKDLYDLSIENKILDMRQAARGGTQIKILQDGDFF